MILHVIDFVLAKSITSETKIRAIQHILEAGVNPMIRHNRFNTSAMDPDQMFTWSDTPQGDEFWQMIQGAEFVHPFIFERRP